MIDALLLYWGGMVILLRLLLPISIVACVASTSSALAWGQSGRSVIAELAPAPSQSGRARQAQGTVGDTSLASISNWADDYKFTPNGKNTYR